MCKHDSFLKLYTRFISSFILSVKTEKEQHSQKYDELIAEIIKIPETNRQSLQDLLLSPIQRIGRYPMLVQQLLKTTDTQHPDHQMLSDAHKAVKTLADHINKKKREEDEQNGLFDAYSQTKNCPAKLITAKRRWIVNVPCTDLRSKRELHLMLFSDLLMLAVPITKSMFVLKNIGEHKFTFLRWIDLLELQIIIINPETLTVRMLHDPKLASPHRQSNTITPPTLAKDMQSSNFFLQFSNQMNFNTFNSTFATEFERCSKEDVNTNEYIA